MSIPEREIMQENHFGYELNNSGETGKLDIKFVAQPSGLFYGPEQISIPTPEETRKILGRTSLLHLPTPPDLMPGSIIVNDGKTNRADFATFGGELQITPQGENVNVAIVSQGAPILDIRDSRSPDAIIAAQFEAMMARSRAMYIQQLFKQGYSPRAAELEFNTNAAKLLPSVNFEFFLRSKLEAINENVDLRRLLKKTYQEFIKKHENYIGPLATANDIFYLAATKTR